MKVQLTQMAVRTVKWSKDGSAKLFSNVKMASQNFTDVKKKSHVETESEPAMS